MAAASGGRLWGATMRAGFGRPQRLEKLSCPQAENSGSGMGEGVPGPKGAGSPGPGPGRKAEWVAPIAWPPGRRGGGGRPRGCGWQWVEAVGGRRRARVFYSGGSRFGGARHWRSRMQGRGGVSARAIKGGGERRVRRRKKKGGKGRPLPRRKEGGWGGGGGEAFSKNPQRGVEWRGPWMAWAMARVRFGWGGRGLALVAGAGPPGPMGRREKSGGGGFLGGRGRRRRGEIERGGKTPGEGEKAAALPRHACNAASRVILGGNGGEKWPSKRGGNRLGGIELERIGVGNGILGIFEVGEYLARF